MSEKIKVRMVPERVESIKEKYGISEDALKEIMASLELSETPEVAATIPEATIAGEAQFMRQLMHGEIGMGEAMIYMDMMDRKDRREREERRAESPPITPDEIGKAVATQVTSALKGAGVLGKPGPEEIPDWAKEIHEQQEEILGRMQKDEEEKRLAEAIDKQVTPLKHELDKAHEKIQELSKPPPTPGSPKSRLEEYLDFRKSLKDAGILKEETGSMLMVGPDGQPIQGIPVKGELPAALVYGPAIVEQISAIIEKRIDKIATKYGLGGEAPAAGPPKTKEPLIKLPEKPTPKAPPPPAAPPTPPTEEVLKLPEKPTPPAEAVAEVTEVEEEKPPELLCSRCDTPVTEIQTKRGTRYRCPKCKKFTKVKKAEKVEPEEESKSEPSHK